MVFFRGFSKKKEKSSTKKDDNRRKMMLNFQPHKMQKYTYKVLQTIQMKILFLCVWEELAGLVSAKTALKFKCEIKIV